MDRRSGKETAVRERRTMGRSTKKEEENPDMMVRISITAALLVVPTVTLAMELCEYLHSIGQPWGSPACMRGNSVGIHNAMVHSHSLPTAARTMPPRYTVNPAPVLGTPFPMLIRTTPSPLGQIIRNVERIQITNKKSISALIPAGKPVCARLKQTNCESDSSCPSGVGCIQSDTHAPCCFKAAGPATRFRKLQPPAAISTTTASSLQCPSPKGICPAKGTMCSTSADCGNPTTPLCCESGCGYGICVRGSIDDSKYPLIHPRSSRDVCPPADDIRCNQRGGISWCSNDGHCQVPGSSTVARYCCPTKCEYNVCLSKQGSQIVIG